MSKTGPWAFINPKQSEMFERTGAGVARCKICGKDNIPVGTMGERGHLRGKTHKEAEARLRRSGNAA